MALQASSLLDKLRRRDEARGLHAPVLDQVCLLSRMIDADGMALMKTTHPAVHVLSHTNYTNKPAGLKSSTWVGGSGFEGIL